MVNDRSAEDELQGRGNCLAGEGLKLTAGRLGRLEGAEARREKSVAAGAVGGQAGILVSICRLSCQGESKDESRALLDGACCYGECHVWCASRNAEYAVFCDTRKRAG